MDTIRRACLRVNTVLPSVMPKRPLMVLAFVMRSSMLDPLDALVLAFDDDADAWEESSFCKFSKAAATKESTNELKLVRNSIIFP